MRTPLKMFAILSLAASVAAPASAQFEPSSPDAIASAAADCWTSTGPSSVDEARLRQLGWAVGSIRSPGGKVVETPLRIYSKRGSSVMLTILDTPTLTGCAIISRVAKPIDIETTAQLLFSKLKAIDPAVTGGRGSKPGQILYLSLPRLAELSVTGTMKTLGTRIIVGTSSAEKK